MILSCTDSDRAIRALLEDHPLARDIEITGGSLEEAFLELTGEPDVEAVGAAGAMSGISYTRYELRRTFRNRRFFFFSLGFPLAFYWLLAAPQRNDHNFGGSGLSVPLYYMVGLAAFGTMVSMISTGARIAGERQVGWTRQLRISPLSVRAYFRAKVLTALRDGAVEPPPALRVGRRARGQPVRPALAGDDRPDPDRPAAVRRAGNPHRSSRDH